ncbi:MAG: hypothetical protein ACXWXQ_03790 [Actinomycetota bacterium]
MDWRNDAVALEVRSRDRNEWIEHANDDLGDDHRSDRYVCECSFPGCPSRLELTRKEYEQVRSVGTHFAIAIDHENPEVDRIISENVGFAVVEKYTEDGRRIALDTDPRR